MTLSRPSTCGNCGEVVTGWRRAGTTAVAWMNMCDPCADLVVNQMELAPDQPPADVNTQILRCRFCGTSRACRSTWRTRCHVCLDDRTVLDGVEGLAERWAAIEPDVIRELQMAHGLSPDDLPDDELVHELLSFLDYSDELDFYTRPGWTVLAGDVKGLPWGLNDGRRDSHGTWGRHGVCGVVQNMRATPECQVCPPEPGSRTHRARAAQPYLLYLVQYEHAQLGPLVKYGVGDRERVRNHIGQGCIPLLVLRSVLENVVAAEQRLRTRHRDDAVGSIPGMPTTFGRGREVVLADRDVDLRSVLADEGVTDVTHTLSFLIR